VQTATPDALNMLLLLSYSDMNGVGPGVWSEWKGNLLWELYERTRLQMSGSEAPLHGPARIAELKEKIMTAVQGQLPISEIERHLALLPDRYVRNTSPEAAATHLRLIGELSTNVFQGNWVQHGRTITELTICSPDRHGLFADIAGTLTAQGIEILSAEINTREDGVAIDVFMLRMATTRHAIEEHKWPNIERALLAAIKGESDVAALVDKWQTQHAPRRRPAAVNARARILPHVVCDNKGAQSATIVEVRAPDQPGLAYKIASAATGLGLEIVYAKITTEKSDAFDVFYVTDAEGMRLSEAAMEALQLATLERLSEREAVATR
jgi:[protein-PII] uridylyltransferase